MGKVVLPTCSTSAHGQKGCVVSDKTAEQRALDSYVNGGLVRPKYTYAFGGAQNWYDSPTEAENAYRSSEFTIKRSLFYYYDKQYYNAFSEKDFNLLKANRLADGYYFDGEKANSDTYWNTKNNFDNDVESGINKIFEQNIPSLFNNESKIVIKLLPTESYIKESIGDFKTDNNSVVKFNKDTNELTLYNPSSNEGVKIAQLLADLHNPFSKKWKKEEVKSGGCVGYIRQIYTDSFNGIKFQLNLDNTGDGFVCSGVPDPVSHPEKMETRIVTEKMNNNISWKYKLRNNFSSLDSTLINALHKTYFDKLKYALYHDSSSPIYKDLVYGSSSYPNQFSLYESKKYYNTEILGKEIISKTGKDNEQVTWNSEKIGDFTTSLQNWKANFHYLKQDKNNPIFPLKIMYYVDNNEASDITDTEFSDIFGETIASTIAKAENIAFMSKQNILRKQYFIYDINGHITVSANDEQTAMEKLRNKVNLDYSYININEAQQIDDQDLDWSDLISDGLYTVYKFKSSTGSWLYFMSYEAAFKRFQEQVGLATAVVEESIKHYRYIFNYNNQRYIFEWINDQQIDEIVKKIYQIIKQ